MLGCAAALPLRLRQPTKDIASSEENGFEIMSDSGKSQIRGRKK
jgi:hypothetical protein